MFPFFGFDRDPFSDYGRRQPRQKRPGDPWSDLFDGDEPDYYDPYRQQRMLEEQRRRELASKKQQEIRRQQELIRKKQQRQHAEEEKKKQMQLRLQQQQEKQRKLAEESAKMQMQSDTDFDSDSDVEEAEPMEEMTEVREQRGARTAPQSEDTAPMEDQSPAISLDDIAVKLQRLYRGYRARKMANRIRMLDEIGQRLKGLESQVDRLLEVPISADSAKKMWRQIAGMEEEIIRQILALDSVDSGKSDFVRNIRKDYVNMGQALVDRCEIRKNEIKQAIDQFDRDMQQKLEEEAKTKRQEELLRRTQTTPDPLRILAANKIKKCMDDKDQEIGQLKSEVERLKKKLDKKKKKEKKNNHFQEKNNSTWIPIQVK